MRKTLTAAALSAAVAIAAAGPARASAGLDISPYAYALSSGTVLEVAGQAQCTGGGTATVTAVATQGVAVVGIATSPPLDCDGVIHGWALALTATGGTWAFGSADAVAVLLDTTSVQIAHAEQLLTVF